MTITVKLWRNGTWKCKQTGKYYTTEQIETYEQAGFDICRHW